MCRACRRVVLHGLLSRHILRLHRSRPTQCCPARRVALAPRAYVWVLSLSRRHVGEAVKLRWSSCQCATHRDGPGLPERCLSCPDIFNADIKVVLGNARTLLAMWATLHVPQWSGALMGKSGATLLMEPSRRVPWVPVLGSLVG